MKLQILAVGKLKAGPEQELYKRFADRTTNSGRGLRLEGPELVEVIESRKGSAAQRKADEAAMLLDRLTEGSRLVMLDERGKDMTSPDLARLIRLEQEHRSAGLGFAIGGPDGHGAEIGQRASHRIRFGAVTWPHQLLRVMLVEQLYRATAILSGHPYHRV